MEEYSRDRGFGTNGLKRILARYAQMSHDGLRANLKRFLEAVIPTAEEVGIRMCIHPDDPPRPLLGLPRVVSTGDDIAAILGMVDSPANGLTLCSGSLGAHPQNDVPGIAARFAGRGLPGAVCRVLSAGRGLLGAV